MATDVPLSAPSQSKAAPWAGRLLSGLVVAFLVMDGGAKVAMIQPVKDACAQLQIPEGIVPTLGVILATAAIVYAIPATSVLGAIVLTGYLGGATYCHVRHSGDVFPILFPGILGAIMWLGLYLREPRLRALVPLK
jgi:hypothetical protein